MRTRGDKEARTPAHQGTRRQDSEKASEKGGKKTKEQGQRDKVSDNEIARKVEADLIRLGISVKALDTARQDKAEKPWYRKMGCTCRFHLNI